jgi:hypothetical protein
MDMCQEMSQCPPMRLQRIPATTHQIGHGTDSTAVEACPSIRVCRECPTGNVSAIADGSKHSCDLANFYQRFPMPKVYTVARAA